MMRRALMMTMAMAALAACATPEAAAPEQRAQAQTGELYLFIYRPGLAWRAGVPMREQGMGPHGRYMQQLLDEGRLFAGGGFDDEGGMAIVVAASTEEAREILAADPAITSGIFIATMERWRPRFRTDAPLPAGG